MVQLNIANEISKLRRLSVGQLLKRYEAVCGTAANFKHKERLVRAIIWHMQARREGGLSDRALLRAAELVDPNRPFACLFSRAKQAPSPRRPTGQDVRLPKVGTIVVRQYRGRLLQVRVLERGFEYEDRIYASLTAVTHRVTGQHWNGFHFFGLLKKDRST